MPFRQSNAVASRVRSKASLGSRPLDLIGWKQRSRCSHMGLDSASLRPTPAGEGMSPPRNHPSYLIRDFRRPFESALSSSFGRPCPHISGILQLEDVSLGNPQILHLSRLLWRGESFLATEHYEPSPLFERQIFRPSLAVPKLKHRFFSRQIATHMFQSCESNPRILFSVYRRSARRWWRTRLLPRFSRN